MQGPRRTVHIAFVDSDRDGVIDPTEIRNIVVNPQRADGRWSFDPVDLHGHIVIQDRVVTIDLEPRPTTSIDHWESVINGAYPVTRTTQTGDPNP